MPGKKYNRNCNYIWYLSTSLSLSNKTCLHIFLLQSSFISLSQSFQSNISTLTTIYFCYLSLRNHLPSKFRGVAFSIKMEQTQFGYIILNRETKEEWRDTVCICHCEDLFFKPITVLPTQNMSLFLSLNFFLFLS